MIGQKGEIQKEKKMKSFPFQFCFPFGYFQRSQLSVDLFILIGKSVNIFLLFDEIVAIGKAMRK